ncbi:MAG: tandem-95 repeat protein, partial [Calditrichaeota bacterium]|nr:tandem-95 repeat protein [Calditrichota bacterium]
MNTKFIHFCLLVFLIFLTHQMTAQVINLNEWVVEGNPANGNWDVSADSQSVLQTINGAPTFFISPDTFINTTLVGKITVESNPDDDFIGFVMGFHRPQGNENYFQFIVFDWKKNTQTIAGRTALAGFTLARVDGEVNGDLVSGNTPYWNHTDSAITILASDYGNTKGWTALTEYEFQIEYRQDMIKISIDGNVIFDISGSFPAGRFGFYNYSQANVRYRSFESLNQPPIANNDNISTDEDKPVEISPLINDSDPNNDPLAIYTFEQPPLGNITLVNDSTLNYTPSVNFFGTDSFKYSVTDGFGAFDTASVLIEIYPVSDPPIAQNDTAITTINTSQIISVLSNDSDGDGDPIFISDITTSPSFGNAIINPGDSAITYTPYTDFVGQDQFQYVVSDTFGLLDTATVFVSIFNSPPIDSGLVAYFPFNGNASDESGNGNDGTVNGASLTTDRFGNPNSAYSFDGQNDFILVNDAPELRGGGSPISVAGWFKSGSTINENPLIVKYLNAANKDWGIRIIDGVLTYSSEFSNEDYVCSQTLGSLNNNQWHFFAFVANEPNLSIYLDGNLVGECSDFINHWASTPANVEIGRIGYRNLHYTGSIDDISIYNRALTAEEIDSLFNDFQFYTPVANNDAISTTLNTQVSFNVLDNDFHTQNAPLSITSFNQPLHGSITQIGDSAFTYTPNTGFTGNDGFDYTIEDPNGNRDSASVSFSVSPPKADLVVSNVQTPTTGTSGQPFAIEWIVSNQGTQGTNLPEWFDRVYLSDSPVFILQQAILLGEFQNFSYLVPGDSYSNSKIFTLPEGISGNYYIYVQTDIRNQLPESNENNNRSRNAIPIDVELADYPNLVITDFNVSPATGNAGSPVSISWTVTNVGDGPTRIDRWFDTVFFSSDTFPRFDFISRTRIRYTDPEVAKVERSGILAAGVSYNASSEFILPHNIEPGDSAYFTIHTDFNTLFPGQDIQERVDVYEYISELDNTANFAIGVNVTPPDLVVDSIANYPAVASVAEIIDMRFVIRNAGLDTTFETLWSDRVFISPDNST